MFVEPPETAYDLRFRVLGVPVRVHPMFWFMALLLSGLGEPLGVAIWVVAVFVSIVVHELGHCAAFRWFGMQSHIVLHGFGGLAIPHGTVRGGRAKGGTWPTACIAFAGPGAGFVFAALLLGAMWLGGLAPSLGLSRDSLLDFDFDDSHLDDRVAILLYDLLFVNIWWGLFNLLPIYPLDGGQISRALFTRTNPREGVARSLMLSWVTAGGLGLLALWRVLSSAPEPQDGLGMVGRFWPVLLFGYLAWLSYQAWEQERGRWGGNW